MSRQRKKKILKETIEAIIAEAENIPSPALQNDTPPSEAQILAYFYGTLSEFERKKLERQIIASPESLELLRLFVEISKNEETEVKEETVKQTTDLILNLITEDEKKD